MLEKPACKPLLKHILSLFILCLLVVGTSLGPVAIFSESSDQHVLAEEIPAATDQAEETSASDQNDPTSAGAPTNPENIVTTIRIDWSDYPDDQVPDSITIIIVPDGNNVYATSVVLSPETNWESQYEMPIGTSEVNFNLQSTSVNFNVSQDGTTYVLTATQESPANDPFVQTVNTNPGSELGDLAIPTANNDLPPNAELKIRLDKGSSNQAGINFVKEVTAETSPDLAELEETLAENAPKVNQTLYIVAAVLAALLAVILIVVRIVYGIKRRRAAEEEDLYY